MGREFPSEKWAVYFFRVRLRISYKGAYNFGSSPAHCIETNIPFNQEEDK
jgi:hypothetical protein